jgi:hypothetical protein
MGIRYSRNGLYRISQRLDPAAQAAQAERRHGLPQLRRGADVALRRVERHAHLKPLVTQGILAHRA